MSKYIDVDAFVENFRITQLLLKVWAGPDLTPEQEVVIQSGEAIIKDLIKFPAADVVPVVRCKDCRHCETDYVHEGEYTCFYTGAMGLTLDDFCSKAEGKDEHDKSNNDN